MNVANVANELEDLIDVYNSSDEKDDLVCIKLFSLCSKCIGYIEGMELALKLRGVKYPDYKEGE